MNVEQKKRLGFGVMERENVRIMQTHRKGNKTRHETTKREHIRDKHNDRRHTHTDRGNKPYCET